MEIEQYIQDKVKIYDNILGYIEGENDLNIDPSIFSNQSDIIETLYIISKVEQNHHRGLDFNKKIKQILDCFLDQIKIINSIPEIFKLFHDNRIILLYLFEKGILVPDQSLLNYLRLNNNIRDIPFNSYYFYPEIKKICPEIGEKMEKTLFNNNPDLLEDFAEKRRNGENESYICSLIRDDSIEKFVIYTNRTNYSLSSKIKPSIFETNPFLIEKSGKTSLIEYAAFCGSIQIYQYLKINHVKYDSSIWYYGIHGNNPIMIHLIESDQLASFGQYESFLIEAIKCHHNNLAVYIKDNLLTEKFEEIVEKNTGFFSNINSQIFSFFNFSFFPNYMKKSELYLYYACYYDYISLVKILYNTGKYDICKSIVSN